MNGWPQTANPPRHLIQIMAIRFAKPRFEQGLLPPYDGVISESERSQNDRPQLGHTCNQGEPTPQQEVAQVEGIADQGEWPRCDQGPESVAAGSGDDTYL